MDKVYRVKPKQEPRELNMRQQTGITIIAWKKLSRRSELLAEALNGKMLFHKDNLPYARAAFKTLFNTLRTKPRVLVLQLPQGPLLLEGYFIKKLVGSKIVADVHTGFVLNSDWKGKLLNAPFVKLLSKADLVLAHNPAQLEIIPEKVRDKTLVVFDPWYLIETKEPQNSASENYLVFPASFASDEPLEEIIHAINTIDNVKLYITGDWKRKPYLQKFVSEKIVFTGFLPKEKFEVLLANATAIITGTKREFTALMSGWEAVAYFKPLALTDTQTLRSVFGDYPIYYNYSNITSITKSILTVLRMEPNVSTKKELKQRTITSIRELKTKIKSLG